MQLRPFWYLVALLISSTAVAETIPAPAGWKEETRSSEIAIFSQENSAAKCRAFQAIGDVDAPPDVVFRIVTDVESHPKFMPFTKESTILQHKGPNEIIVYQTINPPLVAPRDVYFDIKVTPGASNDVEWKSEWFAVPDFQPERRGYVRMRTAEGSWYFDPLDGGRRTRVTYTSTTNIGGLIPAWIAERSTLSVLPKMYEAIRKRVAEAVAGTLHSIRRLLVLAALFFPFRAIADLSTVQAPAGWTPVSRNREVVVFDRERPSAQTREVLAYTEVDATPEQTWRVVTDFDHWAEFMPYIKESRILQHYTSTEELTYQRMSAPLISDRDYYLHVQVTEGTPGNGGVFKSEWRSLPDAGPLRKGIVRMQINEGSWTFEPIDGGKRTRIVYLVLAPPGGLIPEWVVNMSNVSIVPNLFKAVRQRLAKR